MESLKKNNVSEESVFEKKRTFFSMDNKDVNLITASLGLIIYIIIFAILIPYILIRHGMINMLAAVIFI